MISDKKKTPLGEIVLALYIMGYIILSVLPVVKYSVAYVISGLYGLVFVAYYILMENKSEKVVISVLILTLFGAIQGAVAYLNNNAASTDIINEPIRVLRILVPCLIFCSLSGCSTKTKTFLWLFITALFIYISITTLNKLSTDDLVARKLARGSQDEELTEYRMQNIGGFEFSYAFGFMLPLSVLMIFSANKVILKIFAVLFVVYIFYFIMATQYMTLFIITVVSISLVVIFGPYKLWTKIIGVSAFLLMLLLASTILRWVASFDIGDLLQKRLNNMANYFDGNIDIEDTASRVSLHKNALMTFLNNPLTGQANSEAAYRSHSLILGTLAGIGVLGLIFIITEFAIYYNFGISSVKANGITTAPFNVSFICYLVLAVLNPIGYCYEIAIVVFFYVPFTTCLFLKQKTYNKRASFMRGV